MLQGGDVEGDGAVRLGNGRLQGGHVLGGSRLRVGGGQRRRRGRERERCRARGQRHRCEKAQERNSPSAAPSEEGASASLGRADPLREWGAVAGRWLPFSCGERTGAHGARTGGGSMGMVPSSRFGVRGRPTAFGMASRRPVRFPLGDARSYGAVGCQRDAAESLSSCFLFDENTLFAAKLFRPPQNLRILRRPPACGVGRDRGFPSFSTMKKHGVSPVEMMDIRRSETWQKMTEIRGRAPLTSSACAAV